MSKKIVGQRIVKVRPMTEEEKRHEGWSHDTVVIELNNGILLYPSRDEEGNDAGTIFGKDGNRDFILTQYV